MILKLYRNLYKLIIIFTLSTLVLFTSQCAFAQIGVINSQTSSKTIANNHTGNYDNLWSEIIYTLNFTNIKYSVISEDQLNDIDVNKFSILILPLVQDLPQDTLQTIENFVKNNGKIIVIFSDAPDNQTSQKLAEFIKIQQDFPKKLEFKSYVNFINSKRYTENGFPSSLRVASIKLTPFSKSFAVWNQVEENFPAISISDTGSYIGWKWGNDGDINFNTDAMKTVIESLHPGLIKKEQVKLNFKFFSKKLDEINNIRKETYDFIDENTQNNSLPAFNEIQDYLHISKIQENLSKAYYYDSDYENAQKELRKARYNALVAYAKAAPSSIIEGRTIWLDRGTIVSIKTVDEMGKLFDKIQNIGINMIYFETINAGYSIYPSKITEQTPLTSGRDPLLWAIQAAHKRNMELHAWTWVFAVGNVKHNPLIGRSYSYPGPVISKNYDFALLGSEGNMLPVNQNEYWLDPSNLKARNIELSLLAEIVKKYDIDGIQLDYIRYPFQRSNNFMGFNIESRQKFEIETGNSLDKLDNNTLKMWNEWKTKQISLFVKDVSETLRKIKPDIRISAAVFGGNRQKRLNTIQQDWESWVENGWVDILNPMIYSTNIQELAENLDYFVKSVGNKAFIYPGIAVRQLEDVDMLEQIYTIKDKGMVGNTLFAMAHLGTEKSELLSQGPYRFKGAKNPSINPLKSVIELLDDFLTKVDNVNKPNSNSIVNTYTKEQVIKEAKQLKSYIVSYYQCPTSSNIEKSITILQRLEFLTDNWLSVNSNKKSMVIKSITGSLKEIDTLLCYQQHKATLKDFAQNEILTNFTVIDAKE
ncbi:MAG: family 10 glycosylhydrolase [Candidatus Gastranaerophilales bacterium]|nr:family 10 glycosylhydrolase [Candidatus Gastranaerophilales bacterium]